MSQNISVESSTHSSASINPVLQAALGSLDVQLEEELARYRRQRAGRPVMSPRGLGRHQIRKPIELISVERVGGQTHRPALGMSTAPVVSFPLFMVNPTSVATPAQDANPEPIGQTAQLATSSEPNSGGVVPSPANAANNLAPESSITKPLNPESADGGGNLATVAAAQAQPDDYLESSEQLLRSLAEEETIAPPKKRFTDRLLTPLSVGLMLLLLLSSATIAFIVNNPATLKAFGLDRFFGSKPPTVAQSPIAAPVAKNDAPIVNGPDLASDEFVDLNLNTLSRLEATPKPSASPAQVAPLTALPNGATMAAPPVVPNSALPRRSADLSSALLQSSPQAGVVPSAGLPQVAPLPAPAASAPRANTSSPASAKSKSSPTSAKSSKSSAKKNSPASSSSAPVANSSAAQPDGFYYVLVNYGSESALEQARTVVPDAYVRDFPKGARIQMGAFKTESEAKTLVEELQRQGISASIDRP